MTGRANTPQGDKETKMLYNNISKYSCIHNLQTQNYVDKVAMAMSYSKVYSLLLHPYRQTV